MLAAYKDIKPSSVCRRTLAISRELGDRAIEAQVYIYMVHMHYHYHTLSLIYIRSLSPRIGDGLLFTFTLNFYIFVNPRSRVTIQDT